MQTKTGIAHDPRAIAKSIFDEAKLFWALSLGSKVSAAVLGIAFVLASTKGIIAPWGLAIVAAFSELAQWRSDLLRSRAEQLHRKIEFYDGFGWALSYADISDYLAKVSAKRREAIETAVKESFFASTKDQGIQRTLENLQESTWWSKHLATWMAVAVGAFTTVLISGSVLALAVSVTVTDNIANMQVVSRVVSALLSAVISFGTVKLLNGYVAFARKSEQIEEATKVLMRTPEPAENEAIKLLSDYQISRGAAPLIPDLLWKCKRGGLNKLWLEYRRGS